VIFPTDPGTQPTVITERPVRNKWFEQTTAAGRSWTEPARQAFRDERLDRATIGIVGLQAGRYAHVNSADGVVVHHGYAVLSEMLPDATFADATDVVGAVRYVKSAEEIEALRRAAQTASAGVDVMAQEARPSVAEATVYARVMRRVLAAGSEYLPLVLSAAAPGEIPFKHVAPVMGRTLGPDWHLEGDVRAAWGGRAACESQTLLLGPVTSRYRALVDLHREIFEAGLEVLTPDRQLSDFVERVRSIGSRHGGRVGGLLAACGYGDDGPRVDLESSDSELLSVAIERDTVWRWKPIVYDAAGDTRFAWGTTVLATDKGGVLLSGRTLELVSM
jgi:Xaa-Pro aminopeptidase